MGKNTPQNEILPFGETHPVETFWYDGADLQVLHDFNILLGVK